MDAYTQYELQKTVENAKEYSEAVLFCWRVIAVSVCSIAVSAWIRLFKK